MKKFLVVPVLLLSIFLAGCKGGKTVDGKWNVTPGAAMPPGTTFVAEFSGGKDMTMTMDMPQAIPGGKTVQIHGDIKGTYEVDHEYMTMKVDDVKMSGTGFPDALKAQIEPVMKSMGDNLKTQLNKEGKAKMAWVDDDTFTMTGTENKPTTFKRAK